MRRVRLRRRSRSASPRGRGCWSSSSRRSAMVRLVQLRLQARASSARTPTTSSRSTAIVEALSPTFFATFLNTLWVGIAGTVLCFADRRAGRVLDGGEGARERRGILIALVLVPFWTNFLVRTIGWQVILAPEGWLSPLLQAIGVLDGPLDILYTRTAVLIGVVYNYLPLMILPLFVAFDRVGPAAARGVQGPRRRPLAHVPAGHAAAGAARHHRRRAAGLHPADGRLHHRDRARRREGQHGRPARRQPVPDRAELGARLGDGGAAHRSSSLLIDRVIGGARSGSSRCRSARAAGSCSGRGAAMTAAPADRLPMRRAAHADVPADSRDAPAAPRAPPTAPVVVGSALAVWGIARLRCSCSRRSS